MQHIHTDQTQSFTPALDNGVNALMESTIGIYFKNIMDLSKERLHIPVRLKGLGLHQTADHRFAQFVGGMSQGMMNVINMINSEGNIAKVRYNMPAIMPLLGDGAFNGPIDDPWGMLTTHPHSRLTMGIRLSWGHLKPLFQNLCPTCTHPDEDILINQSIT